MRRIVAAALGVGIVVGFGACGKAPAICDIDNLTKNPQLCPDREGLGARVHVEDVQGRLVGRLARLLSPPGHAPPAGPLAMGDRLGRGPDTAPGDPAGRLTSPAPSLAAGGSASACP